MRKLIAVLTVILALSLGAACSKSEESSSDIAFTTSAPPPTSVPVDSETRAQPGEMLMIRSATGSEVVSIVLADDPRIEIVTGTGRTALVSESKDTGKRKYYDASGTQLAEIKSSDGGFKVRAPDGALRWKVKIADDKIKVSDNEENLKPWVLKTGYPDKAKILDPAEAEIGVVRFATAPSPTRVRTASGSDSWTVENGRASAAWGVLMMDTVPLDHQAIIISELLSRGL
jgi:hypothetical protein